MDDVAVSEAYSTGRGADVDPTSVTTRQEAINLVLAMHHDLEAHPSEWENPTLPRFLEALAAAMEGIEHAYTNEGKALPEQPSWQLLAGLLVMASGYE
jgi:hypothetical protein